MKKRIIAVITMILFLFGCTAQIPSLSHKLSEERLKTKNCYIWSVIKKDVAINAPFALAAIPLLFIFPPAALAISAAGLGVSVSDIATKEATKKCGLTIEEAIEQAAIMGYIENGDVQWLAHITPDEEIYVSKPISITFQDENFRDCKVTEIKTKFADTKSASVNYHIMSYYSVCRAKDGDIIVANKSFPEEEYQRLAKIIQNTPPLPQE